MEQFKKVKSEIEQFRFPRFDEIPSMGLFLEQVVKYINGSLSILGEYSITPSMVSNYVKTKMIKSPEQKTYNREQIAHLIFITVVKNVVPLSDIALMFEIRRDDFSVKECYDYLCDEFENALHYVFGITHSLKIIGSKVCVPKELLKSTIMALVYKVHVNKCLNVYREILSKNNT